MVSTGTTEDVTYVKGASTDRPVTVNLISKLLMPNCILKRGSSSIYTDSGHHEF